MRRPWSPRRTGGSDPVSRCDTRPLGPRREGMPPVRWERGPVCRGGRPAGLRRPAGTPAGWFSLCAARYFETYGAGREDLAKIAVKSHHNGTLAPKSMLKREITVDDVLKAPIISWPFGLYDCCAQSDGAAVAVLTRRELAKRFRGDSALG